MRSSTRENEHPRRVLLSELNRGLKASEIDRDIYDVYGKGYQKEGYELFKKLPQLWKKIENNDGEYIIV